MSTEDTARQQGAEMLLTWLDSMGMEYDEAMVALVQWAQDWRVRLPEDTNEVLEGMQQVYARVFGARRCPCTGGGPRARAWGELRTSKATERCVYTAGHMGTHFDGMFTWEGEP